MNSIQIEEAQVRLPELIAGLQPGEEILITNHNESAARLIGTHRQVESTRKLGTAVGKLIIIEEDDEHLEGFEEYMA